MAKSRFRLLHGCEPLPNDALNEEDTVTNMMRHFSFQRNLEIGCVFMLPVECFLCLTRQGISKYQPVESFNSCWQTSDYTYSVWCHVCKARTWEYGYRSLRVWKHICVALLARSCRVQTTRGLLMIQITKQPAPPLEPWTTPKFGRRWRTCL